MSELLRVEHLKKYFTTPRGILHAVDDVSFTLGKTILRLEEPTDGKVVFDGKCITDMSRAEFKPMRKSMQMIFQDPYASLDPRMSISSIIAEPFEIYPELCPKKERTERVMELMKTVGLAERFYNSYPHELDGGRRQRIGIAKALALDPAFIVCDEPVSALDVSIQAQILNLLMDLQEERQISYIFVTHDLSVVEHISDDICVMYLGQVVELCPSDELFEDPRHPYTQALLSAIPVPSLHDRRERQLLKGELTSPIDPKPGCRFAPRCPYATELCFTETPELKEGSKGHFTACHKTAGML